MLENRPPALFLLARTTLKTIITVKLTTLFMKRIGLTFLLVVSALMGFAQRFTDKIDRGIVAVPGAQGGNLVSWRVLGEEYYDVTYNLYCNGALLAKNLEASNYSHSGGTSSSRYHVVPVVKGNEATNLKSKEITRWENGYFDIEMAPVVDRNGSDVTSQYVLNDVSLGDVDGDGVVEFLVKRNYAGDIRNASNTTRFHHYECYTLDGRRLWWIDLGPNLMAGPDEQWDLVTFDWDMDGKAECLMRGADNMIIHAADGTVIKVGNMNYVAPRDEYTCNGAEYLLYMNGATSVPYDYQNQSAIYTPMAYPLPRFESDERDYATVWGKNDTGHRSSKHYFGAPYLDGRKPSIFLGRGCYTRHKMCALAVNPATHELTLRWRWNEYNGGCPWFGNGFHNFALADVDWDGRDEHVFGSMVIDDNGKGLCTTGLGHGDAQHCSDFDPYRKGQEQFTCNETNPACTYYNATTGQIYYRLKAGGDDGRALCGNFSNEMVGSMGRSVSSRLISTVKDKEIAPAPGGSNDALFWSHLNQRIYWDGDLNDGVYASPGSANEGRAAAIYKYPSGRLFNSDGCLTINGTKNNAGAIADIFGDWREEIVMRTADNLKLRIFTTPHATKYRIPTLWHDHQYRNAMVTQVVGYNQPPHKSYFIGELEGITIAPPPLTMTDRTEVANGGTISTAMNEKQIIVCETSDSEVSIQEGASPSVAFFNVPSWVKGKNSNKTNGTDEMEYTYYICTVTGGALSGDTRIVKQGEGMLALPKVDMDNTGNTDVWAGSLNFDGSLKKSALWLNRFAELNSNGGVFKSIRADYASVVRPGGKEQAGEVTINENYIMGFGSRLEIDLYSDGLKADRIHVKRLTIETKAGEEVWMTTGPRDLQHVIEIVAHPAEGESRLAPGTYIIGSVDELAGSLEDIRIEGLSDFKKSLTMDENKNIVLTLEGVRDAAEIIWTGSNSADWDFAKTENFRVNGDETMAASIFVKGDVVNFTDEATQTNITLTEDLAPNTIKVNATKDYALAGNAAITTGVLEKENTGTLTIATENSYTGGNYLRGGVVKVSTLSNANKATGNLGAVSTLADKFIMENGATLQATATVTNGSPIRFQTEKGGVILHAADFSQNASFYGTLLTKKGGGWLKTYATGANLGKMIINEGTVQNHSGNAAKIVELRGGTLRDEVGTTNEITIGSGEKGYWWTANRATYSNKITGEGKIEVYSAGEQGSGWVATRTPLQLNLSAFNGTLVARAAIASDKRFTLDTGNGGETFTLDIPEDVIVQNSGRTLKMGAVTGKGELGGFCAFRNGVSAQANTWMVGNNLDRGDFTFEGSVVETDLFTKRGSCKMTVSGAWTTTGAVSISEGILHLNSGATLGKGALTVGKGATLSGISKTNASLTNSSYTINGTLQPGRSALATSGSLDFGGKNVTFGSTGRLVTGLYQGMSTIINNAHIKNIATLKLASGTTIAPFINESTMKNLTTDETKPDSFLLWTNVTSVRIEGELNYELPELPAYYRWDTSKIQEGKLLLHFDQSKYDELMTGVSEIDDNETVKTQVVNTGGMVVGHFTAKKCNVASTFAKLNLSKGVYLLHMESERNKKSTIRMMK